MKNYIKKFPIFKILYWSATIFLLLVIVYGGYLTNLKRMQKLNEESLINIDHSKLNLQSQPKGINALSYVVGNLETGQIFISHNADLHLYPASISKLMTAAVILDHLSLNDKVVISKYAVSAEGEEGNLEPGEIFTVEDLLKVLLIPSSNDAAIAFEEALSQKKLDLVFLMNEKAKEWGMNNSAFFGSTGLDRKGNFSTAKDLFYLAQHLYKDYPILKEITTLNFTKVYSLNLHKEHLLQNTNILLNSYDNIILSKTGTTPNAKECLLIAFNFPLKNDIIPLGIITLSSNDRFDDVTKLYEWFSKNIILN
ncbi:MAG: D-alanyl-D-alanine carboxypeptidase family protein [Minisyncoccia bacterium]